MLYAFVHNINYSRVKYIQFHEVTNQKKHDQALEIFN